MAQNFLSDIKLGDDIYIRLGDSTDPNGDLQIYHDGANSVIADKGAGHLLLTAPSFRLRNDAQTEEIITADEDGAVKLYYDGSKKIETTNAGAVITGKLGVGSSSISHQLQVHNASGNGSQMNFTDSTTTVADGSGLRVGYNGTYGQVYLFENSYLRFGTNNSERMRIASDGTITFSAYGAGYLKTDANGVISVDTSTIEDTLQSVTDRGSTTTNNITLDDNTTESPYVGYIDNSGANSSDIEYRTYSTNGNFLITRTGNGGADVMLSGHATDHTLSTTTFAGNLTVGGDLIVSGDTVTLSTQTVEVEDNIIVLNKTQSDGSATASTSGISINRGGSTADASFIFDDSDDYWDLTHNLAVAGNGTFGGDIEATGSRTISAHFDSQHYIRLESNSSGGVLKGTDGGVTTILARSYGHTFFDGGNFGIGTGDSPAYKFTVEGSANDDWISRIYNTNTNGAGLLVRTDATSANDKIALGVYADSDYKMVVRSTGNVGINDTSPSKGKLQIDQESNTLSSIQLVNTAQSSSNFASYPISIFFGDEQAGSSARHQASISAVREAWNNSPASLVFKTSATVNGATTALTLDSSQNATFTGNVTTSGSKISVTQADGDDLAKLYQTSADGFLELFTGEATPVSRVKLSSYGDSYIAAASTARVGIGLTNPDEKLHVDGTSRFNGDMHFGTSTGGLIYKPLESSAHAERYFVMFDYTNDASYPFLTNRTPSGDVAIKTGTAAGGGENEHFRIRGGDGVVNAYFTNANLGIGTSSIDEKLHVQGSVNNDDIAIKIENTFDDDGASSAPASALLFAAASNNGYIRLTGSPSDDATQHNFEMGSTASGSFITFKPSGSTALTLDSSQNAKFESSVGIGRSSVAKLTIEGDGGVNSNIFFQQASSQEHRIYAATNNQYNTIGSSSPNWYWGQHQSSGSPTVKMSLVGDALTVGSVTTSGFVGDASFNYDTNSGNDPFYISRSGGTGEALSIKVMDNNVRFESIQDESSDDYGGFDFRMDSGTTEPDFIIRKGTAAPLFNLRGDGNATFTGTIDSKAITALAKGTQLGTSGYYINSTFKDTGDNVGVFLAHNDTANGTGAIAGINQLAFLTYGSAWTQALLLDSSQNATFAGDVTADSFIKDGGTSSQYLMADGSVSTSVTDTTKLPLAGGTLTGQVIFPSAATTKPVLPNGFISRNDNSDTSDRHDIWGISERYYPSNSTAADAWGIQWSGTPNDIVFVGGGTDRVTISLDEGNATFAGDARFNSRVRIGDVSGLSNRGTVRIDTRGDAPADLLFGRDTAGTATSWNNVYWALSSRNSGQGDKFTIYRGSGHASPYNSEAIPFQIEPNLKATFTGDVQVDGDLIVTGNTTSVNVEDLNVEQGEITLNYAASSDTSSSAGGAGIRIQDAVDANNDATILWDATNDEFDFSHGITVIGDINTSGTINIDGIGTNADPVLNFQLDSIDTFSLFVDDSDNDQLKLTAPIGNTTIATFHQGGSTTFSGDITVESGSINNVVQYTKAYSSLDTTGQAVAGLSTASNGASAMFVFETGGGGEGGYQKIVYNCINVSGVWDAYKDIDEGGNRFDVTVSGGSTMTFTFKGRSASQNYTPRIAIKAIGSAINTTYV